MIITTEQKAFATTVAVLLPFAANTLARIATNNNEVVTSIAGYGTAALEFLVFSLAAGIAQRRAFRRKGH